MKYSFKNVQELSNWTSELAEHLVTHYIKERILPGLKSQGWDEILLPGAWMYDGFWHFERKFFIAIGFCPTKSFLRKFETLTKLLKNVPDGFIVKLKKTGKTKTLKETFKELRMGPKTSFSIFGRYSFDSSKHKPNERVPVVDGDVGVFEVKSGEAYIPPHQVKSYRAILHAGFLLRLFRVSFISIEKNEFEIREMTIKNPAEIRYNLGKESRP